MQPHKPKPQMRAAMEKHSAKPIQNGQYWNDPVYQFVARTHRIAQETSNASEANRLSELMLKLSTNSLDPQAYETLEAQRVAHEKALKVQRKKQQLTPDQIQKLKAEEISSRVNTAELKKRIFNAQTSPENMIRAFELLPAEERKRVAKSLTSYLRSKIAPYLKQHNL